MSRAVKWELLCFGRGAELIAKVVGRKEGMGEGDKMRAHCPAQVLQETYEMTQNIKDEGQAVVG